jgi:hypothetical protein
MSYWLQLKIVAVIWWDTVGDWWNPSRPLGTLHIDVDCGTVWMDKGTGVAEVD